MEEIKEYGDLSEQDLLEFLNALEDEDNDLRESQEHVRATEESLEVDSEKPDTIDPEEIPLKDRPDYYNLTPEQHGERTKAYAAERRLMKTRLHRAAFNQNEIELSEEIGNDLLKKLIVILTAEKREMLKKYEAYIEKRITDLLTPLIPRALRLAYSKYPQSVKANPGFIYKASEKYGKSKTYFVKPNLPYFFEQGTECETLHSSRPDLVERLDRTVLNYHLTKQELFEKEISIAARIQKHRLYTYFDLLKFNAMWFNALYEHLTGHVLCLNVEEN